MSIFDSNTLARRRQLAAAALGKVEPLVLIAAGAPIIKTVGLDPTYHFLPHANYYWLTGSRRWGGVLAYSPGEGWTHFVRPVNAEERLWEGGAEAPAGTDVQQFSDWLKQHGGEPVAVLGAPIDGVTGDAQLADAIKPRLDAARRPKDAAELAILQRAVTATAAGFARAREIIRPGITERAIQIEIEAEMFRHGAEGVGYDSIVGAGARAGILHSQPGSTVVQPNDVVLIDAGGEIAGYTADVTRTYPAGGRFTAEQQAIYDVVLAAHLAAIAGRCRPGTEWHDVHRTAAAELAAGLCHLGILTCTVDEALESEAIALFFPHGIGHMVGLGVRDVGGQAPGRQPGQMCCGARVRVNLPIQSGFLMTIEPGLYFVPAILDDPARIERFRNAVAWDKIGRWRPIGGIRIEDNVLLTDAEPLVITAEIPK